MSTYQALYRKWRPKNFGELVGQEPVARTLSNAISSNKLAHAYLFTGPRGTGKTSSARIFAKSLNCALGPTIKPCEACPACDGINHGNFPDVIEIDAASHRGVDDARDLRERVRFAPTQGRYKVFIIDEVHMLTNEAFNALLKTIEEPPPNLVFILATTDVHKVLPTIISRCQRFDFQRIPFKQLVGHLGHVSTAEGFQVEEAGLEAIAKRADGGLRDGLSLLDQVRSCASSTNITATEVFEALGLVSNEAIATIGRAVAEGNVTPAIEGLHALLAAGFDHHAIVRELLEFFRHAMLVGLAPDRAAALEIPEGQLGLFQELSQRLSSAEVLYALEVLRETEQLLRGSNQMTIWLEMAAIRLSQRDEIPSIMELSRRVAALEERLAQPVAGGPARAPQTRPASTPAHSPPPPVASNPVAPMVSPVPASPPPAEAAPVAPVADGDTLAGLLSALAKVHRSTHSLIEQHALRASREGQTLTIVIRATMRTFFEKADRKAYLDKAAASAFGPGTRTVLLFEAGDTARPNPAGVVAQTPASPQPPEPVAVLAAPKPVVEAVVAYEPKAPAKVEPPPLPPVPEPPSVRDQGAPPAGADEVLARAADIFNGRVIDPAI